MNKQEKLQTLNNLFTEAKRVKSLVEKMYSDAMKFTFPNNDVFYDIANDTANGRQGSSTIYNDTTVECAETLSNQMELSLTRAGDNWSAFNVPDALEDEEGAIECRRVTKDVFDKIHNSNFQMQVSRLYDDLIIGTSCLKLTVVKHRKVKKLQYKHLNIGRVYILENGFGEVDKTFYKLRGFTLSKLEEMVGTEIEVDNREHFLDAKGLEETFTVIEMAVPSEKGWDYMLVNSEFSEIFYTKALTYNPFVVTRFKKRNDVSYWGIGKAVERLSLIKTLQHFAKVQLDVIAKDSDPAYIVTSRNGKRIDLDFTPKHINFVPVDSVITPLFTNINLADTNQYIMQLEEKMKQAFLIDSILESQAQNTYKTATEIQIANSKFLDKFATYASSIAYELPRQIFERTYELLTAEGMIDKMEPGIVADVVYVNPITKNEKSKSVDIMLQIAQTATGLVGQQNFVAQVKMDKVMPWLIDKMAGDYVIFNNQEDTAAMREEIIDAEEAAMGLEPGGGMIESEDMAQGVGY